jgi:hypothetical protein
VGKKNEKMVVVKIFGMNGLTYGEKTEWARNEKEKSRNKE